MPPRKRAKVGEQESARRSEGRRRKAKRVVRSKDIAGLLDMPLDVWFEILSMVSPADLLHMARSTKVFRRTLMSRQSITVWQRARERFYPGLPDPSPIMSEPSWINLIFDDHCHTCVSTIRRVIDWELGVRICPRCVPKALTSVNDLPQDELDDGIHTMLPTTQACRYTYKPFNRKVVIYRLQYEKTKARHGSLKTVAEKAAYVIECRRRCEKWLVLSKAGKEWVDEKAEDRWLELHCIRVTRRRLIFDKLKEQGYGEELEDYNSLAYIDNHPFIRENRPLTDRTWNTQFDSLMAFMNRVRVQRLERLEENSRIVLCT